MNTMNGLNTFLHCFYIRARVNVNTGRGQTVHTVHRCGRYFPCCTNLSLISAFPTCVPQTDFALVKQRSYSRKPVFTMLTWYSGSCKCMSK